MNEKANNQGAAYDKEYEAISVEEAIQMAYNELRLPKEKIKIQILTEGKKGLFGKKGSKMAKIRVAIIPD